MSISSRSGISGCHWNNGIYSNGKYYTKKSPGGRCNDAFRLECASIAKHKQCRRMHEMRVPATLASGDIGIKQKKKASVHWQLDRVTLPSHERAMWMSTLDIAIASVPGSVPMGHYGHTGFPSLPPFHWSVSYANAIRNDNDNKRAWIPAIGVGIVSMVNTNSYVVCMCATMSYAHRTTLTERHFQNHSKHFNNFLLFATQEKNEQKDY